MLIGKKKFNTNLTSVMGIINLSEDSFYNCSVFDNIDCVLQYVQKVIDAGVDIIDIGGQTTKPGFDEVSSQVEIERISPVIKAIKQNFDIPISIDTYKHSVAKAALECGADMINDINGLADNCLDMIELASKWDVPICLMHNKNIQDKINAAEDVAHELNKSANLAIKHGISQDKIILDPGIGFGKTWKQNIEILNQVDKLKEQLNFPLLYGYSNKSFISNVLNKDVNDRLSASLSISAYCTMHGVSFIRVHDIEKHLDVVKMIKAILNEENYESN